MLHPLYLFYRAGGYCVAPFARNFLLKRGRLGKEDPLRYEEKLGRTNCERPSGPLLWLHGASIGEALSFLPLAEALTMRGFHILATTGTLSAAAIFGARLPANAIHQFAPLDVPQHVRRFLRSWMPQAALFVESELWPTMITETRRTGAPLFLINARMSQQSYARWRKAPGFASSLMRQFEICFAQSALEAERFESLGARDVRIAGNLKYDVAPPPADREAMASLLAAIGARPVWTAASTHPQEEEACLIAHRRLQQVFPNILTIIAPRDARRGTELSARFRAAGFNAAQRSIAEEITSDTGLYIADTFGEMGLWQRAAPLVFMGKSLACSARYGGQSPIEPAKLGAVALHGPHVDNFLQAYEALDRAGGALCVENGWDIASAVIELLANAGRLRDASRAARATVEQLSGATARTLSGLDPYLIPLLEERSL